MRFVVMAALHFDFQMAIVLVSDATGTKKAYNEDSTSIEYLFNLFRKLKSLHTQEMLHQTGTNAESRQQYQHVKQ